MQETLGGESGHSVTPPFATVQAQVQAEDAKPKPQAPERPQAERPANEDDGDEHGAGEAAGYDLPMDVPQHAAVVTPTARLKEEL